MGKRKNDLMTQPSCGKTIYVERYRNSPKAASQAPGCVEIIGNHTDYNGGYLLTVAIDKIVTLHGETCNDSQVTLYSSARNEEIRFSMDSLQKDVDHPWADSVKGILSMLLHRGIPLGGFRAVIAGDLPEAEELGSSAALSAATALFLKSLYPFEMDILSLIQLCYSAENEFVGSPHRWGNYFTSFLGQTDTFLCLDCQTLHYKQVTLPIAVPRIVLCDSGVRSSLSKSECKNRRQQCDGATRTLGEHLGRQISCLRDISILEFMDLEDVLDDVQRLRARHVLYENQRVLRGVTALQLNDVKHLGELMVQSHESSRDLFENSCPELDGLVNDAIQIPGCYGAKLIGCGFGGWTVNLVQSEYCDSFIQTITSSFHQKWGRPCNIRNFCIGDGARIQY